MRWFWIFFWRVQWPMGDAQQMTTWSTKEKVAKRKFISIHFFNLWESYIWTSNAFSYAVCFQVHVYSSYFRLFKEMLYSVFGDLAWVMCFICNYKWIPQIFGVVEENAIVHIWWPWVSHVWKIARLKWFPKLWWKPIPQFLFLLC
jgi:hypothetical protein